MSSADYQHGKDSERRKWEAIHQRDELIIANLRAEVNRLYGELARLKGTKAVA